MVGHIAVVSNPTAGKGRGRAAADLALEHLRATSADVRVFEGNSAAESRDLVTAALAARPDMLVIIGGDGTLSAVLDLVCADTVPITLVPAGTGNDLARALDVPRHDPAAAAALAVTGSPRAIDVGEVHSAGRLTLFLTVAALGFDAKVSDRTNRLRWPRGGARYYLAILIELARLRPTAFRIGYDGAPMQSAPGTLVAVGSTASYGGGMPVCAGAEPDDGKLDAVHVAPLSRLRLLRLFPLLLRGTHLSRPEVTHRRVESVQVQAPDLLVYADGEQVGAGECVIGIRPRAFTLMVSTPTEVSA